MPKSNRFGKATVLTPQQLTDLWTELDEPYRLIAKIAYFTAARMGEVVQLQAADLRGTAIVYRAETTKTNTTREALIPAQLKVSLEAAALPSKGFLFPGSGEKGYLTLRSCEYAVKKAADMIDVRGVSTHTFRRSLATHMHLQNVPLRAIQRITGHSTLSSLEAYLDVGRQYASEQQQLVLDQLFTKDEALFDRDP
jgi:integrase/recombinase XerD